MTEGVAIIDVWDVETFDSELRGDLDAHTDVIRAYMLTLRRQWLEREASDRTMPYPENPYAGEFMRVRPASRPKASCKTSWWSRSVTRAAS
ncbi:MAG: hypothetical protein NTAFB05_08440 [Nitrobacter sp.]|uniref:hypothetical protein n=1 Tax=Nitrobacter sp. TaxID=29420 RepID=UPI00387DEE25